MYEQFNRRDSIIKLNKRLMNLNKEGFLTAVMKWTFENKGNSLCFAICDYLSIQALRYCGLSSNSYVRKSSFYEIVEIVSNIITSYSFESFNIDNPDLLSENEKKNLLHTTMMKTKYLLHRGDGYQIQLINFANELYGNLNKEFDECFGFTVQEYNKFIMFYFLNTASILSLYHDYNYVDETEDYLIDKSMKSLGGFKLPLSDLYKILPESSVHSILNKLSMSIDSRPKANEPIDFNILVAKPIIQVGNCIMIPTIQTAVYNIHKQFHYDFIMKNRIHHDPIKDKVVKDKYKKFRGELIETMLINSLNKLHDMAIQVYHSLKYYDADKPYEADVTVQTKEVTVLFECKGKLLILNSLKGDMASIKNDFSKMVTYAYKQAKRTQKFIESGHLFKINDKEIVLDKTKFYFKIAVTADHMGFIGTTDREFFGSPNDQPIIFNIYDLEIILSRVGSFQNFINYMVFRESNYSSFAVSDELEVFESYLVNHKYDFDKFDVITPDGFTNELDQEMQSKFEEYLASLAFNRFL